VPIAGMLLCLFTIIILFYSMNSGGKKKVKIDINYNVVARFADADRAAEVLMRITRRGKRLLSHLATIDHECSNEIMDRYDITTLRETDPIWTVGHKAFTVDRKEINICLRDKKGNFYDDDVLFFVFMHELAHVGTLMKYVANDHHPEEYWQNFIFILKEAKKIGIYKFVDFSKAPIEYGDIVIDSNPAI
jgi:hypothetical protein